MNLNDDQVCVLEHLKSKDPKLLRQLQQERGTEGVPGTEGEGGTGDEEVPAGREEGGEARREGDRERNREGATERVAGGPLRQPVPRRVQSYGAR